MIEELLGTNCTEKPRKDKLFGICDDQDGEKAYSHNATPENWIAIVVNNNEELVTFTAIDNCIIVFKPGTKDEESTCDGVLTWNDSIYLVELKIPLPHIFLYYIFFPIILYKYSLPFLEQYHL